MRQMTTIAGLVSHPHSLTRTSDAGRARKPRRDDIRDKIQFAMKTFLSGGSM